MGFAGDGVGFGERAEQEAEGVAELAVDFVGEAAEQGKAGDDVFAEVDAGDPEADDFGAELAGDFAGDLAAHGFGEGFAVFVDGPAIGGDRLEGRAVVHADGAEQRGHEPAAVLVAALGVEVGAWVGAGCLHGVGVEVEDGVGAGAGLEPDVEDVHFLAELGVAAGAGGAGG